jgi:hypothetical protein
MSPQTKDKSLPAGNAPFFPPNPQKIPLFNYLNLSQCQSPSFQNLKSLKKAKVRCAESQSPIVMLRLKVRPKRETYGLTP